MLIVFAPILAALGAALVFRGHEVRGLLVIAVALSAETAVSIATQRWDWVAFTGAMVLLALGGAAFARWAR